MQKFKTNDFTQFELSKQLITSKFFSQHKMSPSARLVLIVLTSHYPNIYPSIKTIQNESGIASKTSVINSLKELAKLGFILYETKNVNHYNFTLYFFESLEIEPEGFKKYTPGGTKIEHKQINNKINNKSYNNFKNIEISYPKYQKPKYRDKQSPLDLSKGEAVEFLKNLPGKLQQNYFATELRKKWGL